MWSSPGSDSRHSLHFCLVLFYGRFTEPVYYIMDASAATFDMNVIIQAASSTSQSSQGTFHHPNVKGVLIVSPHDVIHVAAEGLRTDVYGNVRVRTFHSLDDALAFARSNK